LWLYATIVKTIPATNAINFEKSFLVTL